MFPHNYFKDRENYLKKKNLRELDEEKDNLKNINKLEFYKKGSSDNENIDIKEKSFDENKENKNILSASKVNHETLETKVEPKIESLKIPIDEINKYNFPEPSSLTVNRNSFENSNDKDLNKASNFDIHNLK